MTARPNYSVAQLAEHWQCSAGHVRNMINKGELHAFKLLTQYRIRGDEVGRIEACGLNFIADDGPLPATTPPEKSGGARFGPVIAPPPSGFLRTTGSRRRGTR